MKNELSVLIPCYNSRCRYLVERLSTLLKKEKGRGEFRYEVIVADDGSTDKEIIEYNKAIDSLENCRYIIRGFNTGRAAIRNFLAQQAKYDWLLFMDCDVVIDNENFIINYIHIKDSVAVGGIKIGGDAALLNNNIKYKYEKAAEKAHTANRRTEKAHKEFRTTNFAISKAIITLYPFDEKFTQYGYEDVLMGKTLYENNVNIIHIENPVLVEDYEENSVFIAKTEEALVTLHTFRNQMQGYSTLLAYVNKIKSLGLLPLFSFIYKIAGKSIKKNLSGNKPHLFLFNTYKLLYYISL